MRKVPNLTHLHCSRGLSASHKQQVVPKAVPLKKAILCPTFFPDVFLSAYDMNRIKNLRLDAPFPH